MRLTDFDYELPAERIAQVPIEPRDAARLLVDRGSAEPGHVHVRDLPNLLEAGDLLVVNDTKVIPARLRLLRESGGAVEVLLLEPLDADRRTWEALIRPARKLRAGEQLFDASGEAAIAVGERTPAGDTFAVDVLAEGDPLDLLQRHGEMPLPPYIETRLDRPDRYQTVYADEPASAAAPTAGLHFTPKLMNRIEAMGVEIARVELVVGLDTFKPVSVDDLAEHVMHSERYRVPSEVMRRCRGAKRVVAIGTTTVRALESAAASGELEGRTRLFVRRPFDWKMVDVMMTNFHLPRTTLLMMIDAFIGDRWRRLYRIALDEGYRFLSFGDAMLLDRRAA
ncbi:MAG TPA: tRNA preQ1(34) S-adenosylmethionine ribosyltransferase-isomerase QueA [Ilumatobacteraceae bacterium]|nr:tRNA preQ1(34) S-adenosylmethionine ribosyltransferase-isomerase QueA [Ilumatobacteraceae bacterium]